MLVLTFVDYNKQVDYISSNSACLPVIKSSQTLYYLSLLEALCVNV